MSKFPNEPNFKWTRDDSALYGKYSIFKEPELDTEW